MMFVASPRMRGAMMVRTTPIAPRNDTNTNANACGRNSPMSRPKLAPKFAALPGATLDQSSAPMRACSASSSS